MYGLCDLRNIKSVALADSVFTYSMARFSWYHGTHNVIKACRFEINGHKALTGNLFTIQLPKVYMQHYILLMNQSRGNSR